VYIINRGTTNDKGDCDKLRISTKTKFLITYILHTFTITTLKMTVLLLAVGILEFHINKALRIKSLVITRTFKKIKQSEK